MCWPLLIVAKISLSTQFSKTMAEAIVYFAAADKFYVRAYGKIH